jgi:para-aminobenzoate synthetase
MHTELSRIVDALAVEIRRRASRAASPFVVALDGPSGSGKSTVATALAQVLGAVVVPTDDFFAADVPAAVWAARTPAERAAAAIDWRRVKAEALDPLRAGETAQWFAFDFAGGTRPDGTFAMETEPTRRAPGRYVILDGAYSTRPELLEFLDLTVLIDAPKEFRFERLRAREAPQHLLEWNARWRAAEDHYFASVRPRGNFNIVVSTSSPAVVTVAGEQTKAG